MTKTIILKTLFLISFFCFSGSFLFSQECSNGVSLYQKTYGGTKDDFGNNLTSTSDSGYVIVGQTNSFGNGGFDVLVQKVNKKGEVIWSKAIGGSGYDVFNTVIQTSDNGFIAVGQTKSYGNAAGDAWLVKLDATGNVQWSKKYGDGNVSGEMAYDVVQLADGGYAFAGSHRFTPGAAEGFVTRTDNQGNVVWSKQYGMFGSDQLAGIVEDGNSLVVVGFYQGGSFYDSYVMKLDKSNGAVQWMRGYDAENRSTWFSKIKKTNTGYQVFSVITDNYFDQNQQECVWNLNTDGTLQNVRKLVIPGVWTISYGWLALADGGFIAANGENNNGSDILLSRVSAGGSIVWSKKYQLAGRQLVYSIQASNEGGYALAGNNNNAGAATDSNNVYLMKVDSVGNAGTCSGINTNDMTVISPTFTTPTPPISDLGSVTINNPVITVNAVSFSQTTNTFCFYCQTPDPVLPTDNTCVNGISLYQKTYGGTKEDLAFRSVPTSDSGVVVAGKTNGFGNGGYDGLVMKINKNGNTVWSKTYGGSGNDEINAIIQTNDNGFIACGTTRSFNNPAGRAWLIKLDASGNVQWSKKYGDGTGDGDLGIDVAVLSDGGYALCGIYRWANGTGGVAQSFVVRTDASGNVIWSKQYTVGSASDDAAGIIEDGNSLVVTGYYNGFSSFMDGYIMKLDKANGQVQWIKRYDAENRSTWFGKAAKTNSGYQVLAVITSSFSSLNDQLSVWNLDTGGTLQNVRKLVIPGNWTISSGWHAFADGSFLIANGENNNSSDVIVSKVSANGVIVWSKKFQLPGKQQVYSIKPSFDGGYFAVGINSNAGTIPDSTNIFVMKLDSLGDAGTCSGVNTTDVTVTSPSFTSPVGSVLQANVSILDPILNVSAVNFSPASNTMCFYCVSSPPDVPVVVATANPICAGSSTTLDITSGSLNGATSWKWYTGSCGGTLVGSGFAISVSPTVTTTYYVRGEGGPSGPGNCASITITVNNQTSPTFNIIPPLCQNSLAPVLQTTSNNGVTGSWSPAIISTATAGTTTYTFTPDSNQCATSVTMNIVVIAPTIPAFAQVGPLCLNGTAPVLPATSNNNIFGSWSPAVITTSTEGTTTYAFTPAAGQCAVQISLDITIKAPVTPGFTQIGPLCQNSTSPVLPIVSNNGITGTWSPSTIQTIVAGISTYTFTPGAGQCAEVTTMNIVVLAQTAPAFTQIGPLCLNSTAPVLPTVSNNGITGTWSPATINTTITGTTAYTFTPAPGQCAATATMNINIISNAFSLVIPDTKALNYNGIAYNTVYPEYAPASSITITAQITGGSGSYIYSWSTGQTTQSITVSPTSTTTYTVLVTDASGCQVTASKEIMVQNIGCGGGHKVTMCHITGNPNHVVEICIDDNAVPTHLAAGCSLGECPGSRTSYPITDNELNVQIVPNPSRTQFRLILKLSDNAPVSLKIMDVLGRVIETRVNITESNNLIFGNDLRPGAYLAEITQGTNRRVIKLIKM